jgi:hypothetical protein
VQQQGGFKVQVQQIIFKTRREIAGGAMEKMENKRRFPLSHGTAAAIFMKRKRNFVALGS